MTSFPVLKKPLYFGKGTSQSYYMANYKEVDVDLSESDNMNYTQRLLADISVGTVFL